MQTWHIYNGTLILGLVGLCLGSLSETSDYMVRIFLPCLPFPDTSQLLLMLLPEDTQPLNQGPEVVVQMTGRTQGPLRFWLWPLTVAVEYQGTHPSQAKPGVSTDWAVVDGQDLTGQTVGTQTDRHTYTPICMYLYGQSLGLLEGGKALSGHAFTHSSMCVSLVLGLAIKLSDGTPMEGSLKQFSQQKPLLPILGL